MVAELLGIAERLRAVIIADGPNTTDAAAIDYREDWGSPRIYVVDPRVKVMKNGAVVTEPVSARVAGLIAKIDNDRGFWWSPSNNVINGIVGSHRPVDYALGDPNARANLLNENEVATIISGGWLPPVGQPHLFLGPQVGLPQCSAHRRHDQRVAAARAPLGGGSQHHQDLRRAAIGV